MSSLNVTSRSMRANTSSCKKPPRRNLLAGSMSRTMSDLVGYLNAFFVNRLYSPLGRIEECVYCPYLAGIRDDHVEARNGRLFPCGAGAPRQPPYPVVGVWLTQ